MPACIDDPKSEVMPSWYLPSAPACEIEETELLSNPPSEKSRLTKLTTPLFGS